MMLTDLADACRKSGLRVVERPGWKTRGKGQMRGVRTIVAHHDVTPAHMLNGALGYIQDNSLSQLVLARDGTVYVVAAGLCYHAGVVHHIDQSNPYAIGIEAAHSGNPRDPYPPAQYAAYLRLCAALAAHYRVSTSRVLGHKEIAKPRGRKSDPTFDMDTFRRGLSSPVATATRPPEPEDDMPTVGDIAATVWSATLGSGTRKKTTATLLVEAHAAAHSAQALSLQLLDAVSGLNEVDSDALAKKVAAAVQRADAQAVADVLEINVKESGA